MKNAKRLKIVNQCIAALITNDWAALQPLVVSESVLENLQHLSANGCCLQSLHVLYSLNGIAIALKVQTGRNEPEADQHLVIALLFQGEKIAAVHRYFSAIPPPETDWAERLKTGCQFLMALKGRNWPLMRAALAPDVSWTLPGTGLLSGEAVGIDAVISRAMQLRNFGVAVELNHILAGCKGVALSLHNTAMRGNLLLDEQVAIICDVAGGKITRITTYLNDVEGINAFFVPGII